MNQNPIRSNISGQRERADVTMREYDTSVDATYGALVCVVQDSVAR